MTIGHTVLGQGSEGVIVNHGWFGGAAYAPMLPFLDTEKFSYAFIDFRGYGKSKETKGDYTIQEMAADTLDLAKHLGWERFHLVGHSMGGMAVCRVATDATDRVKSAVAINPVPASGVPFDDEGWGLFSGAAENAGNRRAILDFTTGGRLAAKWLDSMVESSLKLITKEAFGAYLTAWAKTDFAEESKGLKTPIKVIVGENDPAISEDVIKNTYLAWYPNAEMETLTNAGHYPMQETPVYLATTIDKFLEKHV